MVVSARLLVASQGPVKPGPEGTARTANRSCYGQQAAAPRIWGDEQGLHSCSSPTECPHPRDPAPPGSWSQVSAGPHRRTRPGDPAHLAATPELMDAAMTTSRRPPVASPTRWSASTTTPSRLSPPSRRYPNDVRPPVTQIQRPVQLDGSAPRRIPPNGRRSHGSPGGPLFSSPRPRPRRTDPAAK
jgi:hypothetical protein